MGVGVESGGDSGGQAGGRRVCRALRAVLQEGTCGR